MCFWIKSADTGAIFGPFTLDEIRSQIQAGTLNWKDQVHEDTGSEGKSLNSSADWIPISTLCSPESLHRPPTQPQYSKAEPELSGPEHLKALRQNTCYPPARRLIKVIATAALTLDAVFLIMSVFVTLSNQGIQRIAAGGGLIVTSNTANLLSGVVVSIVAGFLILLLRHGLLILVDIADTIIRRSTLPRNSPR